MKQKRLTSLKEASAGQPLIEEERKSLGILGTVGARSSSSGEGTGASSTLDVIHQKKKRLK